MGSEGELVMSEGEGWSHSGEVVGQWRGWKVGKETM